MRVEHQLILSDAHFVHLEKGLDLLMQRFTHALQNGRQGPKQTAWHSKVTISSACHFHAKNLLKP